MSDRRLLACFIAESVGISTNSIHSVLTEFIDEEGICTMGAVPRMLSDVQRGNRVETSLLRLFNKNPDNFISPF